MYTTIVFLEIKEVWSHYLTHIAGKKNRAAKSQHIYKENIRGQQQRHLPFSLRQLLDGFNSIFLFLHGALFCTEQLVDFGFSV